MDIYNYTFCDCVTVTGFFLACVDVGGMLDDSFHASTFFIGD